MHSTGVEGLDKLLGGGLNKGENVVWQHESGTFVDEFTLAFMRAGILEGRQVICFEFRFPPQAIQNIIGPLVSTLPKGWEEKFLLLDCFSDSAGWKEFIFSDFYNTAPPWIRKVPSANDPSDFHQFFGRIERDVMEPESRLVFQSLTRMEHLWGREKTREFFTHVCPALYAYNTLAYWTLDKRAHQEEFLASIEHSTQIVIELERANAGKNILRVKKAWNRYDSTTYQPAPYHAKSSEIRLEVSGRGRT